MDYNFDETINRKETNCVKWDMLNEVFGRDDIIPMWVADMDFPSPEAVIAAIKQRAEHPVYGYTFASDSCYEAVIDKVKRAYGWEIKKEWIVFCDGIVGGVYSSVRTLTRPGDNVVLQPPVYYPFYGAVKDGGCQIVKNPLKLENNNYKMDLTHLESIFKAKDDSMNFSKAKTMILCNPHNPVGRVWTKDELIQLGELCIKNDCFIISDEIHCDIIYEGCKHISFGAISKEFADNSITFISPSKTFNTAGLSQSAAIIPNDRIRDRFKITRAGSSSGNIFGLTALEAAYRYGDDYLRKLIDYLKGNLEYFTSYISENLPELKIIKPEGTYLVWVDMRGLGLYGDDLNKFIINECRLGLDDGHLFGEEGSGFQRFNIACPRTYLYEALDSLNFAIKNRCKNENNIVK